MKRLVSSLALTFIFGLILAACGSNPTETPIENNIILPDVAQTPTVAQLVTVELSVQYDTAVQYNTVNQILRFNYTVKMTKNDLSDATPPNLTISGATATCPAINTVGNLNDRLDTGEAIVCTWDYPITQADLDKGSIVNTATATIYTVNSNPVTTTVPTVPSKLLTLQKVADPTSYYQTGQAIKFNYTVKNSGANQLGPGPFTITDSALGNTPFTCGAADATLAPGATLTCSSTYTITANDMNAASISSTATVAGGGANASQAVSVTLNKTTAPAIAKGATIQHTVKDGEWLWQIARCYGADPQKTIQANPQIGNPAQIKAGMTVTVPNIGSNGNINITSSSSLCVQKYVVVSGDTWLSIADKNGADACLTQIANGNVLTVGKEVKVPLYTKGLNISCTTAAPTSTTPSTSALVISVTANPMTYSQTGQVISLNYTIKNNGTTNLGPDQFKVVDPLFNSVPIACGAANTTLAPGQTVTCPASYTISDVNMGLSSITIKPTATGGGLTAPEAQGVTIQKSVPQLTLSVTPSSNTYSQVDQKVDFIYVITNSGTGYIGPTQFTIAEVLLGNVPFNCGAANTTLTPGQNVTCTGSYTIKAQDLSLTAISSSATGSGGGVTSAAVGKTITRQ